MKQIDLPVRVTGSGLVLAGFSTTWCVEFFSWDVTGEISTSISDCIAPMLLCSSGTNVVEFTQKSDCKLLAINHLATKHHRIIFVIRINSYHLSNSLSLGARFWTSMPLYNLAGGSGSVATVMSVWCHGQRVIPGWTEYLKDFMKAAVWYNLFCP